MQDKTAFTPEDILSLSDCSEPCHLPARYKDIVIPALPKIFITNLGLTSVMDHIFPPGRNGMQQRALDRRSRIIKITAPIYNAQVVVAPAAGNGGEALTQDYSQPLTQGYSQY